MILNKCNSDVGNTPLFMAYLLNTDIQMSYVIHGGKVIGVTFDENKTDTPEDVPAIQ